MQMPITDHRKVVEHFNKLSVQKRPFHYSYAAISKMLLNLTASQYTQQKISSNIFCLVLKQKPFISFEEPHKKSMIFIKIPVNYWIYFVRSLRLLIEFHSTSLVKTSE